MKSRLILAVLLCTAQFAQSQDWTGAVNSDWNNPANWNGFPVNGDDITVSFSNYSGAMAHPVINTNSTFSPGEMLVDGGAVLTINANLTTTDRVEILGIGTNVILNSGVLSISGGAGNARFIFAEQSQLLMSGGQLNVGQRLLFELGASGQLSGGTIAVAETFALIDGAGVVSSSFTQTGGFIETDEFGFENEAGNFHPFYHLVGGTLQVSGAFLVEGAAPGSGVGEFNAVGGIANFQGTLGNLAGSTMNFVIRIENDAILNMSGSTIDQLAGDSIVVSNGGTMNVNSNLVWNNAGVVSGENGDVVLNANTILNGNGVHQFPNLTVLPGKSLSQVSPEIISVNGDFLLAGNYNQLNHVLEFNGTVLQEFNSPQDQTLSALIMNNSENGVSVNMNLTITDSLKWVNGILDLNTSALLFENNALSLNSSEESYAIGTVTKVGDDAFQFPVGSENNRYRPVGISAPTSPSTSIIVNYHPESYVSVSPVQNPLQTVSNLEYWDIARNGSTDFVSVNLGWNDASASGLTDCASISLASWDNSSWTMVPSVAAGLCNGMESGSLQSTSDIQAFGSYTIGFTEGVYQQAVSVCYGEVFTVGSDAYDTTGVYFNLFADINGDDSLVVTALTVLPQLDLTVGENQTYLVSNADGANYQWVDCGNGFAEISGAESQSYYPTQNGNYAVIVELNGCSDTSACYTISHLSLHEQEIEVVLYPNPSNTSSKLMLMADLPVLSAEWIAVDGSVSTGLFLHENTLLTPVNSGFYVLVLTFENGDQSKRKIVLTN